MKLVTLASLLAVLCVTGCRPPGFEIGGGGSVHIPPEKILIGKPTTLELELSVWGEGSGEISDRFADVKCNYQIEGDANLITIPMTVKNKQKTKVIFVCTIPPTKKQGYRLKYYFDWLFDGHYNKREESSIPIVAESN